MSLPSGTNPNRLQGSLFAPSRTEGAPRDDLGEFGEHIPARFASFPAAGIRGQGIPTVPTHHPAKFAAFPAGIQVQGIQTVPTQNASLFAPSRTEGASRDDFEEFGAHSASARIAAALTGVRVQVPTQNELLVENSFLREELRKTYYVIHHSKFETAELYSNFGDLAKEWRETVKQINAIHEEEKEEYERRIQVLEKTNEQLAKENKEMKKAIEDFKKLEAEFQKQKRELRMGQIAYKLETLVSEYVFPGEDKASKRARYGTNLKSLRSKVENLKNQELQGLATSRLEGLGEEMFEEWFIGIVKELKNLRIDTAHPDLGTYEEMKSIITEEVNDDDKREDMLMALDRLQDMYNKLERNFGE